MRAYGERWEDGSEGGDMKGGPAPTTAKSEATLVQSASITGHETSEGGEGGKETRKPQ